MRAEWDYRRDSSFRYCSKKNDEELTRQLVQLAQEKPRYGYRRLRLLLERAGQQLNHKRLYRLYRAAGLSIKRRRRKRLVRSGPKAPALIASLNQQWAIDFVHDVLASGRKFRIFSVLEAHTRECLGLEVDTSFPSRRVTRILDELIVLYGKPQSIRLDNGSQNLGLGPGTTDRVITHRPRQAGAECAGREF